MCYCTVFALFYPTGAYIRRVDSTEGFLCYEFEGLIHGGAYFRNFTVCTRHFFSSVVEAKAMPNLLVKVYLVFFD